MLRNAPYSTGPRQLDRGPRGQLRSGVMPCDSAYWAAKLEEVKAILDAYIAAQLAFATNGTIQEYSIDTGQTVTKVKRSEQAEMRRTINGLMNTVATLETRINGCGTTRVRPGW